MLAWLLHLNKQQHFLKKHGHEMMKCGLKTLDELDAEEEKERQKAAAKEEQEKVKQALKEELAILNAPFEPNLLKSFSPSF